MENIKAKIIEALKELLENYEDLAAGRFLRHPTALRRCRLCDLFSGQCNACPWVRFTGKTCLSHANNLDKQRTLSSFRAGGSPAWTVMRIAQIPEWIEKLLAEKEEGT